MVSLSYAYATTPKYYKAGTCKMHLTADFGFAADQNVSFRAVLRAPDGRVLAERNDVSKVAKFTLDAYVDNPPAGQYSAELYINGVLKDKKTAYVSSTWIREVLGCGQAPSPGPTPYAKLSLSKTTVKPGETIRVTLYYGAGKYAGQTGSIKYYLDGNIVRSVRLTLSSTGSDTFNLTVEQGKGTHTLEAHVYAGTTLIAKATATINVEGGGGTPQPAPSPSPTPTPNQPSMNVSVSPTTVKPGETVTVNVTVSNPYTNPPAKLLAKITASLFGQTKGDQGYVSPGTVRTFRFTFTAPSRAGNYTGSVKGTAEILSSELSIM
jgi:hypothetical protein